MDKLNVLEVSKVEFEIIIKPNFKIGIRDPEDTTISEALDNRYVNIEYFTITWYDTSLRMLPHITASVEEPIFLFDQLKAFRPKGVHLG